MAWIDDFLTFIDAATATRKQRTRKNDATGEHSPVYMLSDKDGALIDDTNRLPVGGGAIGATNETAPGTDTAAAGLNGRLQRLAQHLTTLLGRWPAALGAQTAAGSLSMVPASNQYAYVPMKRDLSDITGQTEITVLDTTARTLVPMLYIRLSDDASLYVRIAYKNAAGIVVDYLYAPQATTGAHSGNFTASKVRAFAGGEGPVFRLKVDAAGLYGLELIKPLPFATGVKITIYNTTMATTLQCGFTGYAETGTW
jgi:hypothetical protein